jgi:hypothetical protein
MTTQHRYPNNPARQRQESQAGATRRLMAIAAGFALAALSLAWAPTALAQRPAGDGGPGSAPPVPSADHAGTGVWAFALVAVLAVLLTIAVTIAFQRIRRGRTSPAAQIKHA